MKTKVEAKVYKNGVVNKFNNKRVIVMEVDDGYGVEFQRLDNNFNNNYVYTEYIKHKLVKTKFTITKESAEVLMLSLAALLGRKVL
jgi:hypothetical protein